MDPFLDSIKDNIFIFDLFSVIFWLIVGLGYDWSLIPFFTFGVFLLQDHDVFGLRW